MKSSLNKKKFIKFMNPLPEMFHTTNRFKLVTFYVNPLHMICERNLNGPGGEQARYLNGPGMIDPLPIFDLRWGLLDTEESLTQTYGVAYLEKIQIMNSYFSNYIYWGTDDPISVLTVTFIYSLNIAVNATLRKQFYIHYSGRVPAITQFLLDHIRLGRLSEDDFLNEIRLNPIYQEMCCEISDWLRIDQWVSQDNSKEFETMCSWFRLLDEHFSETGLGFSHFVRLKTTPMVSDRPLTVTGFAKNYADNSPTVESSQIKAKYVLVNQVLDVRTLDPDSVAQGVKVYPEPDQLADYPEDIYDDVYLENEERLSTELIGFIAGCKPDDLEH